MPAAPKTELSNSRRGDSKAAARKRLSISVRFLDELEKDFEQYGIEAIRNMRNEHPDRYVTMVAALLPREFNVSVENNLNESVLSDELLDRLLDDLKRRYVQNTDRPDGGEAKEINGEQAQILLTDREAISPIYSRGDVSGASSYSS